MDWKRFKTIKVDDSGTLQVHDPTYIAPDIKVTAKGTIITGNPQITTTAIGEQTVLYHRSENYSAANPSWKTWVVEVSGKDLIVQWGKEGTKLAKKTKTYGTMASAVVARNEQIRMKKRKGYSEKKI